MLVMLLPVEHDLLSDSHGPHILLLLEDKTVHRLGIDTIARLPLVLLKHLPVLGLLVPTSTITYLILALQTALFEPKLVGIEIVDLVDVVTIFAIVILLHVE